MKKIFNVNLGDEDYNCVIMYTYSDILTKTPLANFLISAIVKSTLKIDSSISNINICYKIKSPIPILHRQFLEYYNKIENT